jgi:outer membrane protein assembly factor BamB
MMKLRRILTLFAMGVAGLVIAFGVLYQFFGLRMVMEGGGVPSLQFVASPEEQAALIAEHRARQRAEAAAPAPVEPATEPVGVEALAPPAAEKADASEPVVRPYWTDFFGPLRNGEYRELPIRTDWPAAGLTPRWKQPVGGGYASFTVAHGRAFTIEQRSDEEVVAAYDVATGRELWTSTWPARFQETLGGDGPRATPTWFDGTVYALGAQGELRALDAATGRTRWRTNMLADAGAPNVIWGMSASPLIVGDTVVVLPGGPNGKSVVAYDRQTGKVAWSALNDRAAYVSPMLVTLAGTRQLLVLTAERLMGLTPEAGAVLWEYPWQTYNDITVAQPLLLGGDRVFISSGYGVGAAALEVSAAEGRFAVREVWRNTRMKNKFTSSVLHEGFIYGLDEAILACVDAATGELKWKGGRYGYGQVLLASGHLVVLAEDGDLALVRATPARHEEVARFPVLNGKTWNHPALSGGYLLVRNLAEMAAFDLRRP